MTTATPLPLPRATASLLIAQLKRLDCLGFTRALPAAERARWDDWADSLWRADELAEKNRWAFEAQRDEWESARDIGPPGIRRIADAWSRYLAALEDYHRPGLVISTRGEFREMCSRLSGPLVELAPDMPESLSEAAQWLGALDQFWNVVRDLREDARRKLCWVPESMLAEYGIAREDVIAERAPDLPGWRPLVQQWAHETASWWDKARPLIDGKGLPPSLLAMVEWTRRRYRRVGATMRAVDYDYRRFPDVYWAEVRRELGESAGAST